MRKGVEVLALGTKGRITKIEEVSFGQVDYVGYITVRLDGEKTSCKYHPADIAIHQNQN